MELSGRQSCRRAHWRSAAVWICIQLSTDHWFLASRRRSGSKLGRLHRPESRICEAFTLKKKYHGFDFHGELQPRSTRAPALFEEAMTALESLTGLIVIDEVQHAPDPFPLLRVLAGRRPLPTRWMRTAMRMTTKRTRTTRIE